MSATSPAGSGSSGDRPASTWARRIASAQSSWRTGASPDEAEYPSLKIRYSTAITWSRRSGITGSGESRRPIPATRSRRFARTSR